MTLHIVVTAKQVLDPETPLSAFRIESNSVSATGNMAPVINGYDEQAVEAALRIKETHGDAQVTVLLLRHGLRAGRYQEAPRDGCGRSGAVAGCGVR